MNRHKIFTALLAFACGLLSFCAAANFTKYVPITVSGYSGSELTDYPALIKIDGTRIPNVYSIVKNSGTDLKFTDESGEGEYPYEVDTWNPSGTSYVWVRLPSFANGTKFRMYYGDSSKTTNPSATSVWSGYDFVCHVDAAAKDSSANNHECCVNPAATEKSDGRIGKTVGATSTSGGAVLINHLYDGEEPTGLLADTRFSYSFWFRPNAALQTWSVVCGPKNGQNNVDAWGIHFYNVLSTLVVATGSNTSTSQLLVTGLNFQIGQWSKVDVVLNDKSETVYINGVQVASETLGSAARRCWVPWMGWGGTADKPGKFSGDTIPADFDECRIHSSVLDGDVIAANYALETKDDIFDFGEPQSGFDIHKNRVMDLSETDQVAVFCEPGYYEWTPPANAIDFQLLVVGGGGGGASGGNNSGGGGGGGEVIYRETVEMSPFQTYHLHVAPGEIGKTNPNLGIGGPADSSFIEGFGLERIEALGGGNGGGNWGAQQGGSGANGGGGGGNGAGGVGGQATAIGGHPGGIGAGGWKGAGGGGMSEAGHDGASGTANRGCGGAGVIYSITGEEVMYGHGGGGYDAKSGRYAFSGGPNGFGDGATSANTKGNPGEDGTGGGGGAGDSGTVGGSGTVIIRYKMQSFPASVDINVSKQSDANEQGFVAGGFTVTCSEAARNVSFPVRYSVSGTATPGRTYEELSGVAIIPAGQTSVVVPVKPLSDRITDVNSTVILTIVPDSTYTVGSSSSATVTIVNDTNSTSADIRYVKPDGDDSQNGLSPATAYKSLRKAVHDFDATGHGTVYVFPGEYKLRDYDFKSLTGRSCVEVNTAVSIIGVGDTPEDTVLSRDTSQDPKNRRIIYMNHPKAKICNLKIFEGDCSNKTIAGDETVNEAGRGGNIHIGPLGGTVEDCVIANGRDGHWASGGCNVYMDAGRVVRCVITGGKGANNRNPSTDTSYPYHGTAVCAYGGIVENCLMYGNGVNAVGGENNGCTVGLWGRARLVNCTITDNVSDYCGGIAVLSKDAVVQNCVIYGNRVLQGATDHSAEWISKDNDESYSTCFVNCFSDYYIDDLNIMIDNPGFVDPTSHDYRLAVSSVLRDQAVGYVLAGATSKLDLDRNPRRMGSSEDIGCYEFDTSALACDFYADKTEALLRTDLGGTTFNFTAIVEGEYSGALTYEWDFNGDGVYDQSTTNPKISRKYDGIGDTGYFTIGLHVTAGGKEAFMRKVDYLHLAPQNVYVKPDSTGGSFPYNTEDKAAADLYTVIQVSLDGTVVHVAPGTYSYNVAYGRPQLDRGIKVVGSDDPADTVIENVSAEKNAMMLMVNHRDAWVSGLTFKGGCNESDGQSAAGIRVTGNGGTISNCVIRQCLASKNAQHAGIWLGGGLLTHCVIEENSLTNIDEENGYNGNGNSSREQALFVNGPAAVENCLIRNCKSDGALVRLAHADAVMRNCTIVDCTVSFCTENPRNPTSGADITYSHPRLQWPCYAIECENGNGHVYNTVIYNVKRKAYYDIFHNMTWPEADAPFCSNVRWYGETGGGTFPEDPGCCVNCASDNAAPINSSCVLITAADFVNYAAGDLTPKSGGKLHDSAYTIAGWAKNRDLAGNSRIVDDLDIGCYEQQVGGALRKYYVDCLFTGTSTGKKEAPFKTIQEGCAAATQVGSMVFVRGGPGRIYSLADYRDSVTVVADSNCVYGCDADWNPATDFAATNSMAIFAVADDYASQSYTLRGGSTDWPAPIRVSASDCTISGFRAEFGNNSYAQQKKGGRGLIAIDGGVSGTVIENCWFKMKDEFSGYDAVSCVVSGPQAQSASAPKVVDTAIRRCYIWMGKYRASVGAFWNLHNGTRFEKNLVCHLDTLFNGSSQNCGADFHIISNIFLNCANDYPEDSSYVGWFISHLGNGEPARGEIAYNRFIHNDGSTARYRLFQHGHNYNGCWNTDTYIHHNTIVGYDVVLESSLNNASTGMMWLPQIFDNIIVGCGSVFDESATTKWKYGSIEYCSSFREGSMFTKNAVLADNFVTGSATTFDWYDIGENLANTNTTKVLAEMPVFVNTTDPYSENYYRLKVPQAPWVIDAWVGDDPTSPEFPRYVGAVAPQPGGFAVRVR